jgi:hypothetical protein
MRPQRRPDVTAQAAPNLSLPAIADVALDRFALP